MKKTSYIVIGFAILLFCAMFTWPIQRHHTIKNNQTIIKERIQILASKQDVCTIRELAPFEWDTVYFFDPYVSREEICKTIGFSWNGIKTPISEGTMQILFIRDDDVVCYCFGYGEENGYFLSVQPNLAVHQFSVKDEVKFSYKKEQSKRVGYAVMVAEG